MIGVNRFTVRNVRYATDGALIILSFTTEEVIQPILELQTALDSLTLTEIEIIITRSLFDLSDSDHRVYTRNQLSRVEINILNLLEQSSVLIRRTDTNPQVNLEYEWF